MTLRVISKVNQLKRIKAKRQQQKPKIAEFKRPVHPPWAIPLLKPSRYKAVYGGRGGGKSHFFAELLLERLVDDPDLSIVCIREIQKSLRFSAKRLLENKIASLNVGHLFEVQVTEIKRIGGNGLIAFQGMQDHTADSIKSLEGFGIAWVEEAQSLSDRSLKMLRPTIRSDGSEIWFSWNPENESDPVDKFFRSRSHNDAVIVHVNYDKNPYFTRVLQREMEEDRANDIDYYTHVWEGGYNKKSIDQILGGKWVIQSFDPGDDWDGPYFGCDFGLTALVKLWINNDYLYVERESYDKKRILELDEIEARWKADIPGCEKYVIKADCALPQTINYLKRHGFPRMRPVKKWPGSVDDGVKHLRKYKKIIVHERCQWFKWECENYKHPVDKRSGEVKPGFVDKHNHCIDSARYALEPIILSSNIDHAALFDY